MKYRQYRARKKLVSKTALAKHFGLSVRTVMRMGEYDMGVLASVLELVEEIRRRRDEHNKDKITKDSL